MPIVEFFCVVTNNRWPDAAAGGRGLHGDKLTNPPIPGQKNSDGVITINEADSGSLSAASSFLLQFWLQQAEKALAIGDNRAIVLLGFLQQTLNSWDWSRCGICAPSVKKIEMIRTRLTKLIQQVASNLDFHGRPSNYAPLLNIGEFERYTRKILDQMEALRKDKEDYLDHVNDVVKAKNILKRTLGNSAKVEIELNDQIEKLQIDVENKNKDLIKMHNNVVNQIEVVYDAEDNLRNAIEREYATDQCNFVNIIKQIGAVVVIAQTGSAFTGKALAAFGALAEAEPIDENFRQKLDRWRKVLEPPKQEFENLVESWRKLPDFDEKKLAPKEFIGLKEKEGAEEVRRKLDEIVEQVDSDEAREYRREVLHYLDLVQFRNEAIFLRDQSEILLMQLNVRLEDFQNEKHQLQDSIAELHDPNIPANILHLEEFYQAGIMHSLKVFYDMQRALAFLRGRNITFDLTISDVPGIRNAVISFIETLLSARDEIGQDLRPIPMIQLKLSDLIPPSAIERFKLSGLAVFFLTPDIPQLSLYHFIRIIAIRAYPIGIKDIDDVCRTNFIHKGKSVFLTPQGKTEFIHTECGATHSLNMKTEESLVNGDGVMFKENSLYVGVSPFARWHMLMRFDQSDTKILQKIQDVIIEIDIEGKPVIG
jgi:hypothetical protein